MKHIIVITLSLLTSPVQAQTMYKCPSEQGIRFQQLPCDNGQEVADDCTEFSPES